jgi:hypothetical protein
MDWDEPGAHEVAPGVFRVPLSMPGDGLHAINVYAVETGDGLALIDGGWRTPTGFDELASALAGVGHDAATIHDVFVTHIHRDHYTLAIELRRRFGTRVHVGRDEAPGLHQLLEISSNVPVTSEGREHGWPLWSLGMLAMSPALLALFWRYEKHRERLAASTLVPPSVISATRGLALGLLAAVMLYALAAFFLTFAVYQQAGLGRGALAAGLAILPLGIGQLLGPTCGIRLSRWLGSSAATFGMSLEALGLVLAAGAVAIGRPSWLPLPLLVVGIGQGIALPALVRLNVDLVEPRWAGLAAGMVSAAMQLGAALSVALVGGVFFSLAPDGAGVEDVASGFAAACLMIASAMAIAAVLSRRLAVTTMRGTPGSANESPVAQRPQTTTPPANRTLPVQTTHRSA